MRSRSIMVEGSAVQLYEAGEDNSRAILLIHGASGSAAVAWSAVIDLFAESFHILAPDLPGFGESAIIDNLTPARLVTWLHSLLEALEIEQAVVIGSSLGGLIARLFGAAYPQTVPAVVLVDGGIIPNISPVIKTLLRLPVLGDFVLNSLAQHVTSRSELKKCFYDEALLTDEIVTAAAVNSGSSARLMRALALNPMPADQMPQVPTLIMWGEQDAMVSLAAAEQLKRQIPGATVVQMADCGHLPQIEAPDVFVFQVTAFLDRLSRPSSPKLPGVGILRSLPNE